jgi:hypothetical protein
MTRGCRRRGARAQHAGQRRFAVLHLHLRPARRSPASTPYLRASPKG